MSDLKRQIEEARQVYAEQRYPGDLADVLVQTATQPAKPAPAAGRRVPYRLAAVAAALAAGVLLAVALRRAPDDPAKETVEAPPKASTNSIEGSPSALAQSPTNVNPVQPASPATPPRKPLRQTVVDRGIVGWPTPIPAELGRRSVASLAVGKRSSPPPSRFGLKAGRWKLAAAASKPTPTPTNPAANTSADQTTTNQTASAVASRPPLRFSPRLERLGSGLSLSERKKHHGA